MAVTADRLKEAYRKEYDKNPVFTLFLTILIVFFTVFVSAAAITGGDTVYHAMFDDRSDTFMDHFNSILYSYDHPYSKWDVIYPPLITLFYSIIGHFTVPFIDVLPGQTLTIVLRGSQMGMMSLILVMALTFYALHLIFSRIMRSMDMKKELMFLFLILLGYPFIFAVERGNSILLALVFCFIFLLGYRSENKIIRYASYIALGCAAGIKLYPAILLLLLLRDRNYREAGICAAIVAALVLIPFAFTDGDPLTFLVNVFAYSGANLGVTNINQIVLGIFQELLGFSESTALVISYAAVGLFTLLSFIVILLDREMKFWKVVALISCNLILGLGVGTQYQVVYMAMPILYFLAAEKEMTRGNMFYVVCFAMTMVLIPGIYIADHPSFMLIGAIETVFIILIAIAIIREGLARILRARSEQRQVVETAS